MKPADFLHRIFPSLKAIRQDLHQHPEIAFQEFRTSKVIAQHLENYGVGHLTRNVAETGLVATIQGTKPGPLNPRTVGLRADIDALPMEDEGDEPYKSVNSGRAHKCGHDLHSTCLLGAAAYLAKNRHLFSGTVNLIFQPAEEGEGGAKRMMDEGLFSKLAPCDEVYAMHNWPGLKTGMIDVQSGARMASCDNFDIEIRGKGGHGACSKVESPSVA